nr:substrate-binding protein [candidate division Zixibacteria bacterium]
MKHFKISTVLMLVIGILMVTAICEATVKVGLNYPKTGPYSVQGLDQWRAAEMAVGEINAAGGILGEPVEIIWRDSESKSNVTTANVTDMIDNDGVKMVFGGSSSGVAVAAAKVCYAKNVPFFGTLTYSTSTTGEDGLKTTFRECYDSWMAAKAIGDYLKKNFPGKKYLYITADYTWGWTTETSMRKFTGTDDESAHKGIKTPFPGATTEDFKKALSFAKMVKPDVLVLVLFGNDMVEAIRMATAMGLKNEMQLVVPNLTLGMAEGAGPKVMEGVIGALPWTWKVPFNYNYQRGQEFVNRFASKYNRYPSTSGASAYTILYEYKAAVERAKSFKTEDVIKNLEGHEYTLLKDKQVWRPFDHQSVQTIYLIKCKPEAEVLKDKYKLDYFDILSSMPGEEAAITHSEWTSQRQQAGASSEL